MKPILNFKFTKLYVIDVAPTSLTKTIVFEELDTYKKPMIKVNKPGPYKS